MPQRALQGRPTVLFLVCAIHIVWGCLLLSGGGGGVPNVHTIVLVSRGSAGAGAALIAVSALTLFALRHGKRLVAWYLPQQALVAISVYGIAEALARQRYPNGVAESWNFVALDKASFFILAIFHTLAVVNYARGHDHHRRIRVSRR